MALQQEDKASWEDIQALYTAMNTARQKFSIKAVSIPENPGQITPENVTDLNTLVNNMSSNRYLTRVAVTGITPPTAGELIKPDVYTKISRTISRIQSTCAHDSHRDFGDCSDCNDRTFGYDSSDGGCTGFTYGGHTGF